MKRLSRRWWQVAIGLLVAYLGSYVALSYRGRWSIEPVTGGWLWQPAGIRTNPSRSLHYLLDRATRPDHLNWQKESIAPHELNFLGFLYWPLLKLDRKLIHRGLPEDILIYLTELRTDVVAAEKLLRDSGKKITYHQIVEMFFTLPYDKSHTGLQLRFNLCGVLQDTSLTDALDFFSANSGIEFQLSEAVKREYLTVTLNILPNDMRVIIVAVAIQTGTVIRVEGGAIRLVLPGEAGVNDRAE